MTTVEWRTSPSRAGTPAGSAAAAAVLAGALLGAGVSWLMHRVPVDDAFITLSYARQLGLHGNWGMVDGLESNTATSPLSVLLLGGLTGVLRDAMLALAVSTTAQFALAGYWLHGIAVRLGLGRWLFAPLALAVLAVNPLLMSAYGLESQLTLTLLVGAGWAVVTRRPVSAGVLAGLLVLTRPDLGPSALVVLAALPAGRLRAAAAALVVTVPWFAGSWWSSAPRSRTPWSSRGRSRGAGPRSGTASRTTSRSSPGRWHCPSCPRWWGWSRRRAGSGSGWRGCGPVPRSCTTRRCRCCTPGRSSGTARSGCAGWDCSGRPRSPACSPPDVRSPVPSPCWPGSLVGTAWTGVNDGLPRDRFAPISFNWATPAQYEALAERLPAGTTVLSHGEIGTLAWYCECRMVDQFADRGRFTPLLERRLAESGPVARALLEANYARFEYPSAVPLDLRIDTRLEPAGTPGGELTSLFTRSVRVVTISPVR